MRAFLLKIIKKQMQNQNKNSRQKRILALPIWGQKYILSELYALEQSKMEVGHPVHWNNLILIF